MRYILYILLFFSFNLSGQISIYEPKIIMAELDTFEVILMVSDTSTYDYFINDYDTSVKWMHGYEVKIFQGEYVNTISDDYTLNLEYVKYWEHYGYLNSNKKRLDPKYLVWMHRKRK